MFIGSQKRGHYLSYTECNRIDGRVRGREPLVTVHCILTKCSNFLHLMCHFFMYHNCLVLFIFVISCIMTVMTADYVAYLCKIWCTDEMRDKTFYVWSGNKLLVEGARHVAIPYSKAILWKALQDWGVTKDTSLTNQQAHEAIGQLSTCFSLRNIPYTACHLSQCEMTWAFHDDFHDFIRRIIIRPVFPRRVFFFRHEIFIRADFREVLSGILPPATNIYEFFRPSKIWMTTRPWHFLLPIPYICSLSSRPHGHHIFFSFRSESHHISRLELQLFPLTMQI